MTICESKTKNHVRKYYRGYYLRNKERISEKRRKRWEQSEKYRDAVLTRRRQYYQEARRLLFVSDLDYLSGEEIPPELLQEFVAEETNIRERYGDYDVVPEGKRVEEKSECVWRIESDTLVSGGYEIIKKQKGLCVYALESPPRKATNKSNNTPRLYKTTTKQRRLFLYPVGSLTSVIQRHKHTLERMIRDGIIPSVEVKGERWITSEVFDDVKQLVSCLPNRICESGRSETLVLRSILRTRFN